jgi:IS1 family transposase
MTKKILAVHIGNRGKESAKKLINQVPNMKIYCTDDWDAYGCAIEDPEKREIGKCNTYLKRSMNFTKKLQMKLLKLLRNMRHLPIFISVLSKS